MPWIAHMSVVSVFATALGALRVGELVERGFLACGALVAAAVVMLLWSTVWFEARVYLGHGIGEFELWVAPAILSCGIVYQVGRLRRSIVESPGFRPAVRSPGAQAVRRPRVARASGRRARRNLP